MDVVTYHCPSCAAPLTFNIESQDWACAFCGVSYSKDQLESRKAGEGEANGFGEDAAAYECPSCGGRIITDATTAATFCVYCHNPTIIASRLRGEARPDYLIPFKLKKEEAVAAVQKLCRFKPLLPKAFRDSVRGGEVSGLYVPFWLFSSDIDARLDGKGQRIATWSDSKYRYTKTDTFAVRREATISLRHVPADGSAKMDDMLMESLEPFDYKELRDFSMAYISGHFAETYDVDAQTAQSRVIPRMREGAAGLLRGQVSGYTTFRNENMTITPRTVSNDYAMLPVWTLMHEFGGKRYYFAMNAQTGKMVGSLPVSWARFFLIMGGAWLVSFGLFLLISLLGG